MGAFLRTALAAGAAALAVAVLFGYRARRADTEELLQRLEPHLTAERYAVAREHLGREPDPAQAQVQAARALLGQVLEGLKAEPPGRPRDLAAPLELARSLATEAAARRPASWDAALAQGASTYLLRSLSRDDRLFTEAPAWEVPMWRAVELAPGEEEPARFLSMAYLEVWPLLPAWKQRDARELLAVALRDPPTFDRLIQPWLATAGDLEAALELVPAEPAPWAKLQSLFARRGDWPAYCRVTAGWRRHLAAHAGRRLQEARELLAAGNAAGARVVLLSTLMEMPVDGSFAPELADALRMLPPGPLDPASRQRFQSWLDWALELSGLGPPPLPPRVMDRLAGWARDLPPSRAALAALASGDLARAELYERRHAAAGRPTWAPYLLFKAGRLAERGDRRGAAAALAALPPSWRDSPAYWHQRLILAQAQGNDAEAEEASRSLAALGRSSWPAAFWRWRNGRGELDLFAGRETSGLRLAVREVGKRGGVVQVRWDGAAVAHLPVAPEEGALRVEIPVAAGLHRLEVETVAGDRVLPGAVSLAPEAQPTAP